MQALVSMLHENAVYTLVKLYVYGMQPIPILDD